MIPSNNAKRPNLPKGSKPRNPSRANGTLDENSWMDQIVLVFGTYPKHLGQWFSHFFGGPHPLQSFQYGSFVSHLMLQIVQFHLLKCEPCFEFLHDIRHHLFP